ncbi:MAG: hypothetical protein C0434_07750 [Xanthomonadaceae bacterium]|nr:hypothetical protein [Xanthomonadaceae bacterium]
MTRPAILDDRHYTYADYLAFPEDERWEIIDGVACNLSPSPAERHLDLVSELLTQARSQLRGKSCRAYAAPFGARFEASETTSKVVQPDLLAVCDRSKITGSGLVGAPDWIIEVLSPRTAGKDQIVKRQLYQANGVREYRPIQPVDQVVTVYRLGSDGGYGVPDISELIGTLAASAVPGITIDRDLWQPLDSDPS